MSGEKHHHRIPKAYMKSWCFSGDTVWTYNKESKISEPRNIRSIMGVNYFHSIKASSIYTTTNALNRIFAPLSGYKVFNTDENGVTTELVTKEEMNQGYYNYKNWIIKDNSGRKVTAKKKRIIFSEISKISDNSIEEWSQKFENSWQSTIAEIENAVRDIHDGKQIQLTYSEYKILIDYFIMFQWRSISGYAQAQEVFDWISNIVPEIMQMELEESVHKEDKTIADELWHNLLYSVSMTNS